jgi:hypothetical protein
MKQFVDIERALNLIEFTDSDCGTLYCVSVASGASRLIVRHFDQVLPHSMVSTYVELLAAAAAWNARDARLSELITIEPSQVVGVDFIARRHFNATSLDAFVETDPEEDPPEPPPQLGELQRRYGELAELAEGAHDKLLTSVLSRSMLEPAPRPSMTTGTRGL